MEERTGIITMKGDPLTLLGKELKTAYLRKEILQQGLARN